mmetsp:Transcript_8046/g.19038  ORF Transcript_8046/g.19038 Transcript_8046/m.19038 type:complete len:175 (-) Transcript_8046:289-813(-)
MQTARGEDFKQLRIIRFSFWIAVATPGLSRVSGHEMQQLLVNLTMKTATTGPECHTRLCGIPAMPTLLSSAAHWECDAKFSAAPEKPFSSVSHDSVTHWASKAQPNATSEAPILPMNECETDCAPLLCPTPVAPLQGNVFLWADVSDDDVFENLPVRDVASAPPPASVNNLAVD